jgi:hypothetical protein
MAAEDLPISPQFRHTRQQYDDLLRSRTQIALAYWVGRRLSGPQYSHELAILDQARQSALDILADPADNGTSLLHQRASAYLSDSLPGVLALEELTRLFGGGLADPGGNTAASDGEPEAAQPPPGGSR